MSILLTDAFLHFLKHLGCGFSAFEKEKMSQAMIADKQLWKQRPMTQEFLSYAAQGMCILVRSKVNPDIFHTIDVTSGGC